MSLLEENDRVNKMTVPSVNKGFSGVMSWAVDNGLNHHEIIESLINNI